MIMTMPNQADKLPYHQTIAPPIDMTPRDHVRYVQLQWKLTHTYESHLIIECSWLSSIPFPVVQNGPLYVYSADSADLSTVESLAGHAMPVAALDEHYRPAFWTSNDCSFLSGLHRLHKKHSRDYRPVLRNIACVPGGFFLASHDIGLFADRGDMTIDVAKLLRIAYDGARVDEKVVIETPCGTYSQLSAIC